MELDLEAEGECTLAELLLALELAMGEESVFCAGRFDRLEEYLCGLFEFRAEDVGLLPGKEGNILPGEEAFSSTSVVSGSMLLAPLIERLSYAFLMAILLSLSESLLSRQPCCWIRFGWRAWVPELEQGEPVIVHGQVTTPG